MIVEELLNLQNKKIYDAHEEQMFSLRVEIILHILDYPGIGKVFKCQVLEPTKDAYGVISQVCSYIYVYIHYTDHYIARLAYTFNLIS